MSGFRDRSGLGASGFTDRSGLEPLPAPGGGDPRRPVVLYCRLVEARAKSLCVFDAAGVTAWLPRSLIRVEEAGGALAAMTPGQQLRITLPAWKAEEAGLSPVAGDGQGRLV